MPRRTPEELDQAAAEAEAWLDNLDPATTPARDGATLRAIIAAVTDVAAAEGRLRAAVAAARHAGHSWSVIGMTLGVSKQAASTRFGPYVESDHGAEDVDEP